VPPKPSRALELRSAALDLLGNQCHSDAADLGVAPLPQLLVVGALGAVAGILASRGMLALGDDEAAGTTNNVPKPFACGPFRAR